MTVRMPQNIRRWLTAGAVAGVLLLIPATFSSGSVQANDACADGSCCAEPGSFCENPDGSLLPGHYWSKMGCSIQVEP